MSDIDVNKLAKLARIAISPDKEAGLKQDIKQILGFVLQVQTVAVDSHSSEEVLKNSTEQKNVFRSDDNPHPRGKYTEEILAEAPTTEDGFVKVKKIL